MVQLSHPCMTTGKTIALTVRTFLSSLPLVNIHLGFCDTVSCFLPYLSHSWWQTTLLCLPPTLELCMLSCSTVSTLLPVGREGSSSSQRGLLPWSPDLRMQVDSFTSSKPAWHFPSGSAFRSMVPPCTLSPRPETWDLTHISFSSPSASFDRFKIIPPASLPLPPVGW